MRPVDLIDEAYR